MKGMKQQPADKETAKYNAVASMAELLRESTIKQFKVFDPNKKDRLYAAAFGKDIPSEELLPNEIQTRYVNSIFSHEEHETVKRAFLRLVSEL